MNSRMKQLTSMSLLAAGLIAGLILCVGCNKSCKKSELSAPPAKCDKVGAAKIEQTTCPVKGGAINKGISTVYKGKKVYFCCPACKTEFEKNPEKYISKLPQFQK